MTRLSSLLFLITLSFSFCVNAQISGINYTYSTQPYGVWTANAGTSIIAANADDVITSFTPTAATWSGFYFGSQYFPAGQPIYVSSNGFMAFLNPGSSIPTNSLATNPYAIIAPIWDDLKVGPTGNVNWKITGALPNRRLIVEWNGMLWDKNGTIVCKSVQVTLNERTSTLANVIDIKYNNHTFSGNTNINNGSGGASIGLSGFCSGDYYSWPNAPGGPGPVKTAEVTSLNLHPSLSFFYRLTPAAHPNDNCASAFAATFNPGLLLVGLHRYQILLTSGIHLQNLQELPTLKSSLMLLIAEERITIRVLKYIQLAEFHYPAVAIREVQVLRERMQLPILI